MADHHAGLAIEARKAAHDRQVIGKRAVAVQFLEVGEDLADVVERVGPLRVARDLRDLPRAEARVDVLGKLQALLAEPVDLLGDVDGRLVLHIAQFFDFGFEISNRLLEIKECFFSQLFSPVGPGSAPDQRSPRRTRHSGLN